MKGHHKFWPACVLHPAVTIKEHIMIVKQRACRLFSQTASPLGCLDNVCS